MSQLFEGIEAVVAIVDGILVWDRDVREHNARLKLS